MFKVHMSLTSDVKHNISNVLLPAATDEILLRRSALKKQKQKQNPLRLFPDHGLVLSISRAETNNRINLDESIIEIVVNWFRNRLIINWIIQTQKKPICDRKTQSEKELSQNFMKNTDFAKTEKISLSVNMFYPELLK